MVDHVFGPVLLADLAPRDRICNEPFVSAMKVERVYHLEFTVCPDGDFVCNHCGMSFLHGESVLPPSRD
jgi:hypothetical protein